MAGENIKKVAKEAGISITTLEWHYGVYMEREVQRNAPKKRNANKNTRWKSVPDGI